MIVTDRLSIPKGDVDEVVEGLEYLSGINGGDARHHRKIQKEHKSGAAKSTAEEYENRKRYIDAALSTIQSLREEKAELEAIINTPENDDFIKGVSIEAQHQIQRWGDEHDAGKTCWDWFWLIGYLAQKAAHSDHQQDWEKCRHHTITTAAACLNWHKHISQKVSGTENISNSASKTAKAPTNKDKP